MSEFLYNAQVTTDDLNNIALDLGASSFSVFNNSYPYAVDQLNAITGDLISSGVALYGERFAVAIDGESIVVGTGLAIFDGGVKYKLTMPVTLPLTEGELFIELNKELNTVSMKVGTLPASGMYVHIATIASGGTVTDRRVFAKSRVLLQSEGSSYGVHFPVGRIAKESTWSAGVNVEGASEVFIVIPGFAAYIFSISNQTFTGATGRDAGTDDETPKGLASVVIDYNAPWYSTTRLSCTSLSDTAVFEISTGPSGILINDIFIYVYGGESI